MPDVDDPVDNFQNSDDVAPAVDATALVQPQPDAPEIFDFPCKGMGLRTVARLA